MSVQAFTFLQSSEQNSLEVHYAGTPSKGSKSVEDFLGEAKLLQRGSPMQQTMEKQSRAIFDIEAAPSELDCSQQVLVPESDQFHEGHGGSESLRRHASDVYLSSSTLPLGLQAGEPLPKISSSQTMQGHSYVKNDGEKHAGFMKAVSTDFEGHMLSNDLSTMDTTFLKDPCISEEVRFENKGLNLFSNFEDVRRVRYMGKQSGRIELSNDLHTLKDGLSDGLNEVEGSMVEFSNDNCSMSDASKSHDEDYEFNENSNPKVIACSSACFEKGNIPIGEQNSQLIVPKDDMLLSMQNMKENDQECESKSSANVFLDEYQTLPLWVKVYCVSVGCSSQKGVNQLHSLKWRGKWQTGLRCPLVDCPLSTLKAKPTHERKKYISIFFPRTRTYSWVDMLLVCSINEFPHPLACGTHRRWRKLVKDLSAPRRYILQKLAIALLNIGDELHTEAIIEVARVATTWKDFAMECSHCRDYPSLGKMLLKLQSMILPKCVHKDWLENSLDSWMQRCRSAQSAESIESLTEELVESIMWTKVNELWTAPMKPELDPEWKTWKQEAMKLFFASYQEAVDKNVEQNNSDVSVKSGAQTSRKRLKLEIRRPETSARIIGNLECQVLSHNKCPNADPGFGISDGVSKLPLKCNPDKVDSVNQAAAAGSCSRMFDQGNETKREEKFTGFPYSTSTFAYETGSKEMVKHAPGQSNTSSRYRQCLAFIEAKGRQCGRWASDGDIYCCVHLTYNPSRKIPQVDHALPVEGLMCQGTTTRGKNCKHRARYGSTFCKKHRFQGNNGLVIADTVSASSIERLKEKQQEEGAPEKISSSYASGIQELILVREDTVSAEENLVPIKIEETLDERNCLMKQSELCNALPKGICTDPQHCIGNYGSNDSPQCLEFPRRHSLYCENHLPKFLKRARNGKTRLISKDIFINLLNNCSSRKQKINLHQACELLYGFLKSGLSCQKFVSRSDSVARLLAEASKDLNVGEYLLKLVSSEKEKIMSLWGFDDDTDKQVSTESNSLSTMNQNSGLMVKCKSCAQEFSDDHMLGRHWAEVHKKDARQLFKGYVCAVCMSLFTNRKVLETHVIEKHGVQFLEHSALLRCVSCNSHFVNPEKLWQHVFSLHLSEMRMPNFSGHNCNMLDDNPVQMEVETRMEHSQENGVPEEVALQKYICQFCGLNFDLLPDLGRHHQIAHMNPTSTSSFSSKRADYFLKNDGANHFGLWKNCGSNFRFKNRSKLGMVKNFNSSGLMTQLKSKLYKQPSEASSFGGLSESSCCHVAEILFPKIQKTKVRPSNLEILSVARSACCRVNLNSTLVVKYGILPENIYLKAAKLCSELNILVGWHQEGFVCPRGCKPVPNPYVLAPLEPLPPLSFEPSEVESRNDAEWEMDECHYLLDATNFNWKSVGQTIILCEDVSFGKEAIPVACVVDEDLKHLLEIDVNAVSSSEQSGVVVPWQGFVYVTERLIDSSLRLDTKSSQLGCSCRQPNCYPDKCDHVYLFNNDYENAVDIHGESMNGRFPYDDQGRILLEEGYLVYECNSMCCCDMSCKNRVLQKGVQVKLEVFRTEKKGWAVRTRESISQGTFVCEYIGEVLKDTEANKRCESYDNIGCSYLYDIDAHIDGARGLSEGTVPYVIDATKYGNVSRFINHSCSPNLVNYLVLVESMDCQLAHIGLFTNRDVAPGEELSYDYCSKLLPGDGMNCHCGASNCRGRLC